MEYLSNEYLQERINLPDSEKSPWRLSMERRRAEEPKVYVRRCLNIAPVRQPRPKSTPKPRSPRKSRTPLPLCGCGNRMYHGAVTCYKCTEAVRNRDRVVCGEPGCCVLLQRNNTLGKCLKHARELRVQRSNAKRKPVVN